MFDLDLSLLLQCAELQQTSNRLLHDTPLSGGKNIGVTGNEVYLLNVLLCQIIERSVGFEGPEVFENHSATLHAPVNAQKRKTNRGAVNVISL